MSEQLPDHVRDAFQVGAGPAEQLGSAWDYGFRVGNTVFSRALNPEISAWSSKNRESLKPTGVRVVRPIRSTDGRFVVAGWRTSIYSTGVVSRRVDETVVAALRLADALVGASMPTPADTVFTRADIQAWEEKSGRIGELLHPLDAPDQVGHADMLATTLFSGTQPPVVTDIVPVHRPHGFTAALVIIDGLLLAAVDDGILRRFSHLPDIDQLLLRAFLYRRNIREFSGDTDSNALANLDRVEELLVSHVSDTI
ncbi:TIGR02569 family protein [Corynebacterium pacaense]|uniref:TIGR02569 family protein n=1 Tax=Corynebacterium pacaense TaxID=1816684 RepID=UPI0009BB6300|nr:TIGR02569 family protein [Corynebacterium pacaense]